ncbi:serine/arginine repetitive matrix protein 2 [Gemmiger formicilis]
MPRSTITMQVENFQRLMDTVAQVDEQGRKAVKNTVKDVKARAPGWIAAEVVQVYNIKKSEITPASGKGSKPKKMAGSVRITGETIEEIAITYEGRMLTPVHFGLTPKSPPAGKSYTLKMQVVKGQKKVIGRYKNTRTPGGPFSERSHNILMGTGSAKADGVSWIPFQRMSRERTDLKKFTATSVPQMITSELTSERIMTKLQEETAKRLQHNLDRALGR